MSRLPISVLDLAMATTADSTSSALTNAVRLAQCADELGFHRFWVAEHHNMDTVASTNPAVLIAHLASQTPRIRLGSGGVQQAGLLNFRYPLLDIFQNEVKQVILRKY